MARFWANSSIEDRITYSNLLGVGKMPEDQIYDQTMGRYEDLVLSIFENRLSQVNGPGLESEELCMGELQQTDPRTFSRIADMANRHGLNKAVRQVCKVLAKPSPRGVLYIAHNRGFLLAHGECDFGITILDIKSVELPKGKDLVRPAGRVKVAFEQSPDSNYSRIEFFKIAEDFRKLPVTQQLLFGVLVLGGIENKIQICRVEA